MLDKKEEDLTKQANASQDEASLFEVSVILEATKLSLEEDNPNKKRARQEPIPLTPTPSAQGLFGTDKPNIKTRKTPMRRIKPKLISRAGDRPRPSLWKKNQLAKQTNAGVAGDALAVSPSQLD